MFVLTLSFSSKKLQQKYAKYTRGFRKLLHKISALQLPSAPKKKTRIQLIFITDKMIQKLNAEYRQKNYPTDVLSFFLFTENSPEKIPLFGEIYISLETAERQANESESHLSAELNTLFVHGALHLLGFDHENDTDFRRMNTLEKKILKP